MISKAVKTCLRYPGGKFYGVKKIKQFYSIPHDEFREVFVGGASVFLNKPSATKLNWINDIDSELINFYKVIQMDSSRLKLYKLLANEVATKERHKQVLEFKPKNKIERAFKYFYLNRTSFSGIMNKPRWGYALGSSVVPEKWIQIIDPVGNKLKGIKITNLDYKEVVKANTKNGEVLMYLDPPYFDASKGIYTFDFTYNNHLELCKLLKKTKYKFILSYENSSKIKDLYNWANIYEIEFRYYLSEARRQNGKELVITNFDRPQSKLFDF